MTATGGSCEPRSLSSQNTDPRGKRAAGPLISGIKSRKYEYLSLQSEPLCTAKSWLFSAPFECLFLLAEWNCLALQHICGSFFPPSTASRHCAQWDRGQRLHCRLCGHKKATILLGFMIIMSKIKTHLMPQEKKKISLWLRAVAGASKCEDKVERNHDVSLGVVPLFMTPHVWHKRCKVARWFEQHSDGSFITADSVNTYFLQLTCVVSQLWCRSKLLLNFRYFFFTSLKSVNECELKFKRT